MSSYLVGRALQCRIGNPYGKLLLVILADRADDGGRTTPAALSYLAAALDVSETTVKKYRAELAAGSKDKPGFNLIKWKGKRGTNDGAIYRIDVPALERFADDSMLSWLNGRDATIENPNGRDATIEKTPDAHQAGSNGRDATKRQTNQQANKQTNINPFAGGPLSWENAEFITKDRRQKHEINSWKTDPVIVAYCEAFHMQPERLQHYHRELLVSRIEDSAPSLELWIQVLEDYRGMANWSPFALNNLIDRYWRYRNDAATGNDAGRTEGSKPATEDEASQSPEAGATKENGNVAGMAASGFGVQEHRPRGVYGGMGKTRRSRSLDEYRRKHGYQ